MHCATQRPAATPAPLLGTLVERVGARQVVVGTDRPFDMGIDDPRELVGSLCLGDADRDAILGGNARGFLSRAPDLAKSAR